MVQNTQKRASPSARKPNALTLLTEDHKKVKKLFSDFKKLGKGKVSDRKRRALVEEICTELTIHTQVEEEIFYPAIRAAVTDTSLLDEADIEHASAKSLISQLRGLDPVDDHYDARVIVLSEYIDHHVKEEQEEMFPLARNAKLDLGELGAEILQRKRELQIPGLRVLPKLSETLSGIFSTHI